MGDDRRSDEYAEWTIPDGAVLIYEESWSSRSCLVKVVRASTPGRYGAVFIQFPERGETCGGSSWAHDASAFREPRTTEEHLWMQQYLTAKRVKDLEAELARAKDDAEVVARYAVLHGHFESGIGLAFDLPRSGASVPGDKS